MVQVKKPDIHAADILSDAPEFSKRDLFRVLITQAIYLDQQIRYTRPHARGFSKAELRRELARFEAMRDVVVAVVRDAYPGWKPEGVSREWDALLLDGWACARGMD